MLIRLATQEELPALQAIEQAAGYRFHDVGMTSIAEDEPLSLVELAQYQRDNHALVLADNSDQPIAYLIFDTVDGNFHIAQVSVHPKSARQGLGRQLIDYLAQLAVIDNVQALTLTTFASVPWNAPYYQRCGFRALTDAQATPGLRAIRLREAERGLDQWSRVCMRRDLP